MLRRTTIVILVALLPSASASADTDALPIIEKAFASAKANEAIARNYVFHERVEQRRLNKKGKEKKTESWTWDVTLLDHSELRRLIAKDDEPLDSKATAKEQRKVEKRIKTMQKETPKQRRKRLAKIEKEREEGEEFLEEITRAFDFRLIGEEDFDGVATYLISAEPKPGYEPKTREGKVLTSMRGTLWITKEDYAWVQADIETFAPVKFAVVFKLHEGARIRFRQRRINDEVWMTDTWYVRMRAKAALVYKFNAEITGQYSNFRRFTADSTLIQEGTGN